MEYKNLTYIDKPAELKNACRQLSTSDWLAIDTEFLRETTYYPKFCLLQISNGNQVVCIDPIAIENLAPLKELLYSENTIKIFHAGRQDLEIFFNLFDAIPKPIFDTQIAAPLLGYTEQIGYAALVQEVIGVSLDKAHSRTDWSNRPLTDEQLKYAFDDVHYLGIVYEKMHGYLSDLQRLLWLHDDFQALTDPAIYSNTPELAWNRIRGLYRLSGAQLTIVQGLAEWREQTAQEKNKPRTWLLKDDTIIDLARLKPQNPDEVSTIRGISNRTHNRYAKEICAVIENARSNPPIHNAKNRLVAKKKTPEQEAMLDLLMAVVRVRGAENSLNPTTLCSRKDLQQLFADRSNAKILQGWRKNLIGDELIMILEGKRHLSVNGGTIHIENIVKS